MPPTAAGADDPHAAPAATKPIAAKPGSEAPAPKELKPESKVEAKPKPEPSLAPKAEGRPTATPQEVAARIAKKVALMRAEKVDKSLQEIHVRRPVPPRKTSAIVAKESLRGNPADRHETHWSYGGDGGPIRWGEMNPEWAKCGTGSRQSPIDIRSGIKVDLEPIIFDYKPTGFNIIDTGYTIQVNIGDGNYITVAGRMYELLQFHFHRPSEEKINGRSFDMVMHLVHRDSAVKLAVVAILIERGAARKLVQTVWNNLPLEKNELVTPSGALDMNEVLPAKREYFTYMGSLTTPPCSEGVLWLVMKTPVSVSPEQIDIFARLYQMNARPIQSASDRLIKESN